MSVTLIQTGAFVLLAKYIYRKQSGIWYFRRRIPNDVLKHYPGRKGDIRFSLKTRDESEAASLANQHADPSPLNAAALSERMACSKEKRDGRDAL